MAQTSEIDSIVEGIAKVSIQSNPTLAALGLTVVLVDTTEAFTAMITDIKKDLLACNFLNLDFEGIDLCKTGKVCLGQFHVGQSKTVYVLDFIALPSPFTLDDGALQTFNFTPF